MVTQKNKIWPKLQIITFLFTVATGSVRAELTEDFEEIKESPAKNPATGPISPDDSKTKSGRQTSQPGQNAKKQPSKSKTKSANVGIVKFWSKSLSGFRDQGSLMLEEDVVVTQDDIRLEADKATIFFERGSNDVSEVHAVGSVKFSRNDPESGQPIKAEGKEAVFSNAKRTVALKGQPVLYRGEDVVRGKVIYYDLTNGWVKADRVEGVVQPAVKKAGAK